MSNFTPLQETATQQQIFGQQQQVSPLPPGAQIVNIPQQNYATQQPQSAPQVDRRRRKAHMAVAIIFGIIALIGTVVVWVGGFVNSYNSGFIAFYLILLEVFVGVPVVLTIISTFKEPTNLGLTVTSLVVGGIVILATFIAGAIIGSNADYNCRYSVSYYSYYDYYYGYYYYDNYTSDRDRADCISDTIAAVGLFVICFSTIAIIVIASLETKRGYFPPAPQRTQFVIVQQPGMQPMTMNIAQPVYIQNPPTYTMTPNMAQPVMAQPVMAQPVAVNQQVS